MSPTEEGRRIQVLSAIDIRSRKSAVAFGLFGLCLRLAFGRLATVRRKLTGVLNDGLAWPQSEVPSPRQFQPR